jgi:hypothetical protein
LQIYKANTKGIFEAFIEAESLLAWKKRIKSVKVKLPLSVSFGITVKAGIQQFIVRKHALVSNLVHTLAGIHRICW